MTDIDEAIHPILPRELTSISSDVHDVGSPAHPHAGRAVRDSLADPDADADLVSEWMNRPHLVEAWEYDWPPARWRRYLRAQLDGAYSRPFIGSRSGRDVGYIELYRAAKGSITTRGDRRLSRPGESGLHRVVASVFAAEPHCQRIMFDPDHRNSGARRLCEYAGCTFLGEHAMANRRMALYALPRSPAETDIG